MVEELIILPEAELDIVEAYDWYEERRALSHLSYLIASIMTVPPSTA